MTDSQATAATAEYDRSFREIVLCLGGIFAALNCDDALIVQITRSLERIYERTRARLLKRGRDTDGTATKRRVEPHPAVEDLLARIGR